MTTLDDLDRRLKVATGGNWAADDNGSVSAYTEHGEHIDTLGNTEWKPEDEALALEARNALPDLLKIALAVAAKGGVWLDDDQQEFYCATCGERDCTKESLRHAEDCGWVLADKLAGGGA
jgi:hypothetical protein